MIWVKYNGRYDYFDKNWSKAKYIRMLNSDNNHFVSESDLPTLAEKQGFACKNVKFTC